MKTLLPVTETATDDVYIHTQTHTHTHTHTHTLQLSTTIKFVEIWTTECALCKLDTVT